VGGSVERRWGGDREEITSWAREKRKDIQTQRRHNGAREFLALRSMYVVRVAASGVEESRGRQA